MSDGFYEFTLTLDGVRDIGPEVMAALVLVGCDDATPSVRDGQVYLRFTRSAPSFSHAVSSAIGDIGKAGFRVPFLAP